MPYPPNRGDRIRSYNLLEFLAERANVSLATLADEPLEPGTLEALAARCEQVAIEPLGKSRWLRAAASLAAGRSATEGLFRSRALRKTLHQWTSRTRFQAVVVFCSSMVQYLDLPGLAGVPAVVDLVDVDSQKFFDYAAPPIPEENAPRGVPNAGAPRPSPLKRLLYRLEGARLRRLECSLPARVSAITLVSEAEANLYRGFCPNNQTHAVTNGVDLKYFHPAVGHALRGAARLDHHDTPPRPDRCVFVGALDYPPNIEGITWFCRQVWPQVRESRPAATLAIVGRNPNPAVRRLAEIPGVEVVGGVPDVRPHLAAAVAAVVPLRIARGVQNKVLEALACAKPLVASPCAAEGLGLIEGEDLLLADTPAAWHSQLCRLLTDPLLCRHLGQNGRQFVEHRHHWNAALEPFAELLGLEPTDTVAESPSLVLR